MSSDTWSAVEWSVLAGADAAALEEVPASLAEEEACPGASMALLRLMR